MSIGATLRGVSMNGSKAGANVQELRRRIICGICMVGPVSAFLALAAWYIAV